MGDSDNGGRVKGLGDGGWGMEVGLGCLGAREEIYTALTGSDGDVRTTVGR